MQLINPGTVRYVNRDDEFRRQFKRNVRVFMDRLPAEFARHNGFDQPPAPLDPFPPTREAVANGLERLRRAELRLSVVLAAEPTFSPLRSRMDGRDLPYAPPVPVDLALKRLGIPLTFACVPNLAEGLFYGHGGLRVPQGNPWHPQIAAQLSDAFLTERDLWVRAGEDRIPYPFVYWALQHIRKPEAPDENKRKHNRNRNRRRTPYRGHASLCVRCGEPITYYVRRRAKAALRCPRCAREAPHLREWPSHAVMPHTRGMWVLKCQAPGCGSPFLGPRRKLRCDTHRSSQITPGRRAPRP
jgi:hypothetical protein